MELCNYEPSGAVAQLKKTQKEDTRRPPLGLSEKNNAVPVARKIRTKEIASRYKSVNPSSANSSVTAPRRYPSPNVSRTFSSPQASLPTRAQSAERRRPSTPSSGFSLTSSPSSSRPSTPSSTSSSPATPVRDLVSDKRRSCRKSLMLATRTPDGLWPSMRLSSSSSQSESISAPCIKKEILVTGSLDHTSKSSRNKVAERNRTPLRGRNSSESFNSKLVEKSCMTMLDRRMWPSMSGKAASDTSSRSNDLAEKASKPIPSRGVSPRRPANTLDRVRKVGRDTDIGLDVSSHPSESAFSVARAIKSQPSPVTRLHRSQSPSRNPSRPSLSSRVTHSPSRTRPSTTLSSSSSIVNRVATTPSVLNYISDVRKGKKSANHLDDAHQLRMLYNRHLQWRFVNARAEDALSIQKIRTKSTLRNVWNNTSELCDDVVLKRINLLQLKDDMKLKLILEGQMSFLEKWAALDGEHRSALSGANEALKASTLRLPVTGGARADVHAVKNAVNSAIDVMQAMGSSIGNLLSKVDSTKALISELSAVAVNERALLEECRELLASTAIMQIQESSLITHLIQLGDNAHKVA